MQQVTVTLWNNVFNSPNRVTLCNIVTLKLWNTVLSDRITLLQLDHYDFNGRGVGISPFLAWLIEDRRCLISQLNWWQHWCFWGGAGGQSFPSHTQFSLTSKIPIISFTAQINDLFTNHKRCIQLGRGRDTTNAWRPRHALAWVQKLGSCKKCQ